MKARVALNGRFSHAEHPAGTHVASFHLFDAILRAPRDLDLVVFADPEAPGVGEWRNLPGVVFCPVPFRSWSRSRCQFWEQAVFASRAARMGCGVVHSPMNTSPARSGKVRSLVTLHDLNFHLHPEWYHWTFRLAYRWVCLPGLRRANRVAVISDYIRQQAMRRLGLDPNKIRVIPNGLVPLAEAEPLRGVAPFIFAVGSYQPHKNLDRLLQAHRKLRKEFPDLELRLAGLPEKGFSYAGEPGKELEAPGVLRLGYLDSKTLTAHYRAAKVFCFPSLEEGFGLPVLEAMSQGAPVVTSRASCLPEVAGDAALLVDPTSVDEIAQGLRTILTMSDAERSRWDRAGRARAAQFSWARAARQYLDLYREMMAS